MKTHNKIKNNKLIVKIINNKNKLIIKILKIKKMKKLMNNN